MQIAQNECDSPMRRHPFRACFGVREREDTKKEERTFSASAGCLHRSHWRQPVVVQFARRLCLLDTCSAASSPSTGQAGPVRIVAVYCRSHEHEGRQQRPHQSSDVQLTIQCEADEFDRVREGVERTNGVQRF